MQELNNKTDDIIVARPGPSKREGNGLDLNMSAKEMREKLNLRRKVDPRREEGKRGSGDWWMQYKMIQTL